MVLLRVPVAKLTFANSTASLGCCSFVYCLRGDVCDELCSTVFVASWSFAAIPTSSIGLLVADILGFKNWSSHDCVEDDVLQRGGQLVARHGGASESVVPDALKHQLFDC